MWLGVLISYDPWSGVFRMYLIVEQELNLDVELVSDVLYVVELKNFKHPAHFLYILPGQERLISFLPLFSTPPRIRPPSPA